MLIVGLALGAAALAGGYLPTKDFVKRKLRFVEVAQKPAVPVIAGVAAAAVAWPIAALLPLITGVTALAFGVGVGAGWRSGQGGSSTDS
jgi:hypothetical protein